MVSVSGQGPTSSKRGARVSASASFEHIGRALCTTLVLAGAIAFGVCSPAGGGWRIIPRNAAAEQLAGSMSLLRAGSAVSPHRKTARPPLPRGEPSTQ